MTDDCEIAIIKSDMSFGRFIIFLFLCGCVSDWRAPDDFVYRPVSAGQFEIATWQKITDSASPIHIYIEGDGRSFDGRGQPTYDPTPRGTFLRNLAMGDNSPNVVYMARPCQFIMSASCTQSDWTDGRFSARIIDSMANAITNVARNRPVILIGYSGGAMVSGLVIARYPNLNVKKWITVAGVLNHGIWTDYFGDSPLSASLSLDKLPNVPQLHYVAEMDETVPPNLTKQIADSNDIIIVPNATHDDFGNLTLDFSI